MVIGPSSSDGRCPALPRPAAVSTAAARCVEPTQTLDRAQAGGYGPDVRVTSVGTRRRGRSACAVVRRPDFLRFGYGVDVLLPGRHRFFQRQQP